MTKIALCTRLQKKICIHKGYPKFIKKITASYNLENTIQATVFNLAAG